MLTLTALLFSLTLTTSVANDAVLLLSVSSNAGRPTDDAEVARRIAAELTSHDLRVSRSVAFKPGCENDAACVDEALAGGRALIGLRCDVVRAGPVAQVSVQVFAHQGGILIADERVVMLDELHAGAPILAPNVVDAILARAVPATTGTAETDPPTTATEPGATSESPSTGTTSGATDAEPGSPSTDPAATDSVSAFPLLGATGLGVAALGAVLGIVGGGVLSMQLQILQDPAALGGAKETATLLSWASIASLAAAVVVAGAGTGLAAYGFMTHYTSEPEM